MSAEPTRAVKLFGTDQPVEPMRRLSAGPLTAELDAGNLRYVRLNGAEAIRAISFIVRDRNWGTYNPAVWDLRVEENADGFTVTYAASCGDADQNFEYEARIVGRTDGTLRFEATGRAVTDFLTNRTGFVVLHPIRGVAGEPVEVLHVDGTAEQSRFPALVDPVQPFRDIRALTHAVMPGVTVTCRMEGDTFEMEDQRNWTDASYKTYVRPLALPWPYTLKAGETLAQAVELTVRGTLPAAAGAEAGPVKVAVDGALGAMPRIGLGVEPRHLEAAIRVGPLIRHAGPQFLVCHFDPRAGHGVAEMRGFARLADATGAEPVLEAVLPAQADPGTEIRTIAAQAAEAGVRFAAVTVSPAPDLTCTLPGSKWPDCPPLEDIYRAARDAFPGVILGGGMFSYFTELNRKRPSAHLLDFVTHTTSAVVHAGDDTTVTETLESLPAILASTRAFIGDRPYRVGPSAIGMRQNPYGDAPMENPGNGRKAMARMDPRQRGLLGAAWNLGYVAHMVRGGVEAVALSAPVGEFGIVHAPIDYPQPWFDEAGGVYPVFHVIFGMAAAAGREALNTEVSRPREVQAVAHRVAAATVVWLANLTGERQRVAVSGVTSGRGTACWLDEATFVQCCGGPDGFPSTEQDVQGSLVDLDAYAVCRLSFSDR
jgi:hypothetical protein